MKEDNTNQEVAYGPVYCRSGEYEGRIGFYDGQEFDEVGNTLKAVVYFGNGLLASSWKLVEFEHLGQINSSVLFERKEKLTRAIFLKKENGKNITQKTRMSYLEEIELVNGLLADRMYEAMFTPPKSESMIFLSHSSEDKPFVVPLAVDLRSLGYNVWLDEWEILAGQSIPTKIARGVQSCDFLILVLSPSAVSSRWVETEWQAKYWQEIEEESIRLVPVLAKNCEIPTLLRPKKYVDFTKDYTRALDSLCFNLKRLGEC